MHKILGPIAIGILHGAPAAPQSPPPAVHVSRADLFIATFGPSSNNQGLRTSRLEQEEQVKLAFYGIDATRARVAAGELSEADGSRITEGFESTIRNYVHDRSQDALI